MQEINLKDYKAYHKKENQLMKPYVDGMDITGVSISSEDKANGSPKVGDMIAINLHNLKDKWLVAKEFFEANYTPIETVTVSHKSLHNTTANGASKNVKDIVFWGNGDSFKLISKASSEAEGWMKSTKGMDTGNGVIVQVTTQQRNPDGSYAVAEALTFVPNVQINNFYKDKVVVGRFLSKIK